MKTNMRQITIDNEIFKIIKIYPFKHKGQLRKSIWLRRPNSRGVIYNTTQYGDGSFAPVVSFRERQVRI